ncbi:hypothetical protein R5R35_004113 [Gryllus longicercus]|uniref:SHSP domain-containing protein n=1 Tax=Gryllus longicercus TaxID=2509291 RepID=A0AAN9VU43_9ORTH|nr:Protein lethal(2)essential for life [Gryllus bimaculatus]
MLRTASRKIMPALRPAYQLSVRDAPIRHFWDFRPSASMRSLMREMERFERDFLDRFPLRNIAPRFIPVEGNETVPYRVNIDVNGFKPEEINVAVKDKVLTIRAKMERSSEDGGKFYQEVSREITLPENIKSGELKSFLNNDGVLTIEAPYEPAEKPKEIPVSQK